MKVLKPQYVENEGKPIFSVDIAPCSKKFATGGQGTDSGKIVIWSMLPVLCEKAEQDKSIPKILCSMENHLGCVNSVRWSSSGTMLASGGDDKLIMIWKRVAGGSGSFGSHGMTKNSENWRCCFTLRGHTGDVLDLAWSPQDRWLASCSVDNTVMIWDAMSFPTIVSVLKGHTGLVKGVTWDPVGKFLASQSDDRSVKIWKTSDWTCQSTITEPFEDCGGTTHILRLSWSPDGQYLVSAHAMNGGGPTAQIIERDGWKCDKDFVGHRKAVTCVRFHNSIMKRSAPKTNKTQQYCCVAIGSRDRTLSVWLTALQRPMLVIHDLFQDSILDLSWSSDGYILLACSGDGSLACLQFTADELGKPLSEDDKNSLYQRMYGKDANIDIGMQAEKELIIENADLLTVSKDKMKPPSLINTNSQSDVNDWKDTMRIQSRAPNTQPIQSTTITQSATTSPNKPILKQIETRTTDGKRRITPMFIPTVEESAVSVSSAEPFSSSSRNSSSIVIEKVETPEVDKKPVLTVKPADLVERNVLDSRLQKPVTNAPVKSSNIIQLAPSTSGPPAKIAKTTNSMVRLKAGQAAPLQGQCIKTVNEFRIQILNDTTATSHGPISKVVCINLILATDRKIWELVVGSPICSVAMCAKYLLLGSMDGSLRMLDVKIGQLVIPVLSMTSPVIQSSFSPNGKLGGIITENGLLKIWNFEEKSMFLKASLVDILSENYVTMFYITEPGVPFISISNGSAYSYSKQLESWMVVNANDAVTRCGMASSNVNQVKNMKVYPLATVQMISNSFQQKQKGFVDVGSNDWQAQAKVAFIENQIQMCCAIDSSEELKYWYSMLGYNLALLDNEKRIRLLLDDLLGPILSMAANSTAKLNHKMLSVDKHDLLVEVLKHFKNITKWQRLYMEYNDQLIEYKLSQPAKLNGNSMEIN